MKVRQPIRNCSHNNKYYTAAVPNPWTVDHEQHGTGP